jgi:hypothetical protein
MRINVGYLLALTSSRFTRWFRVMEYHSTIAWIVYRTIDTVGSNYTADKFNPEPLRFIGPKI